MPERTARPPSQRPSAEQPRHEQAAEDGDARALRQWLRRKGVSERKTTEVLHRSGCRTPEQLALYLRFQLPPLEFANDGSIADHMHTLFGVGARRGRAMISELRVAGARCASCLRGTARRRVCL